MTISTDFSNLIDLLVLSATPLPDKSNLDFLPVSGNVRFATLSTLRRETIAETVRLLHSLRVRKIVVTGDVNELSVFGDLLSALSLSAPADERWLLIPGQPPRRIRFWDLPGNLIRIALNSVRGLKALLLNLIRARMVHSPRHMAPPVEFKDARRCLYLRSTLMFGMQVGGSVGHVAGVVNALHRGGERVRYLGVAAHPLLEDGVEQHVIPPAFRAAYPNELNNHRYHEIFFREALKHAIKFQPTFIYQRYSVNDLTGARLRQKLKIPLVLEFNGSEVWVQKNWGKALRFNGVSAEIEAANLRNADLVVVISEETEKLVMAAGVPESRVLFYPNCVDPLLFDPYRFGADNIQEIRRKLGVPTEADLFTFVGTFGQWHGTDVLASAIRSLVERDKSWLEKHRIHFLLVGDGMLAQKVRAILGEPAINRFVTLTGFRPQHETPAILAASNVLLSPHVPNSDGSRFFGSPTKLFEYMAMEKLIVASDLDQIGLVMRGWAPGNGEISDDRLAGLLVKPGDCESLVSAIKAAGEMRVQSRREFGQTARSLVLRSFTWDKNVSIVLKSLQTSQRALQGSELTT